MTLKREEVDALAIIHERPECGTCYGMGVHRYDEKGNASLSICATCGGDGKRPLERDEVDALILVLNETRAQRDVLLWLLGSSNLVGGE